jgi:hypothetical protein
MRKDINIGDRFGNYVVCSLPFRENKQTVVDCICDCGEKRTVRVQGLKNGTKSCRASCHQIEIKFEIGSRFGRLVVIGEERKIINSKVKDKKISKRYIKCICDCGNETSVYAGSLTNGCSTSCGCFSLEFQRQSKTTHGKTSSSEYNTWMGIRGRCLNQNNDAYDDYGGRGISVCKKWMTFEGFYEDMGDKPGPKYSIDRVDNNGNYCKENCRWATRTQQVRNRRNTRMLTVDGITMSLPDWAEKTGVKYATIKDRLNRHGYSDRDAIYGRDKIKNHVNIGDKFGVLTICGNVVKVGKKRFFPCACSCGKERLVRQDHLSKFSYLVCHCKETK